MTVQEAKNKLVATAKAELGYREGSNNYTKFSADPNITKLYGWTPQNQPWCCTFVNWAFLTTFGYDLGSKLTYGGTASCNNSAQLFKNNGAWSNFPQVGDQAFFYSGGGINHTGLVVEIQGTAFYTIEGNYSDKVSQVRHNVGNSDVAGFGRPKWELIDKEEQKPVAVTTAPAADIKSHYWKPSELRHGTKGTDVFVLQALLVAKNFYANNRTSEIDGDFGAKTTAAVNAAKQFHGLLANGICDQSLWKKLLEVG